MNNISKKSKLIIMAVLLLLVFLGVFFAIKSGSNSSSGGTGPRDGSSNDGRVTNGKEGDAINPAKINPTEDVPGGSTTSSGTLLAPGGSFVSNHKPNLSGYPAPNVMDSVCITSPNAVCEIHFSKNGLTKILGPEKANANGIVNWQWKLFELGLTEGDWAVEAFATLDNTTKSTKDTLTLEVRP